MPAQRQHNGILAGSAKWPIPTYSRRVTVTDPHRIDDRHIGRYVLEDLVTNSAGTMVWRANDPALNRDVVVRLIDRADPRADAVREAALAAAAIDDRRLVSVLDVIETDQHLAVVTEWIHGRAWSEMLDEPWGERDTTVVAYEAARGLEAAHRAGLAHGRLRPSSIVVTDTNEVRVRGLGVDSALWGVDPLGDPRAADVHGIGALLMVGLTGRWPHPSPKGEPIDGIASVCPQDYNGYTPLPRDLVQDVPECLNEVAARSVIDAPRPAGVWPYPDVSSLAADLNQCLQGQSKASGPLEPVAVEPQTPKRNRLLNVMVAAVAAVVLVLGAGFVGLQILGQPTDVDAEPVVAAPNPPAESADTKPVPITAQQVRALPAVDVSDYDPQGGDRVENPQLVPLATDGDLRTAWRTVRYASSDMEPKKGTGLIIDLGTPRAVRTVRLDLVGSGTDVQALVSSSKPRKFSGYEPLAGVVAAGESIELRTPIPRNARYILVWLTNLPFEEGAYQGGIREVQVLG